MTENRRNTILALGVGVLLLMGIARASTSRFQEREKALREEAVAEQKRLGLTDRAALFARYPTPEITLCRMVRVVPGSTAVVAARGKFQPGTKFLLENDSLEVVKEAATASEYNATVAAAKDSGPTFAFLHAFAPVSAGVQRCLVLYVGGKYEWEFTADNGWRILLRLAKEGWAGESEHLPRNVYRAEFYRAGQPKPFETFDAPLSLEAAPWQDSYSATFGEEEQQGTATEELNKLQEQLMTMHKLPQKEQQALMKRMEELVNRMAQEAQAAPARMQELERRKKALGCTQIHFRLKAGAVQGHLACQDERGMGRTVAVKGTMKFAGP